MKKNGFTLAELLGVVVLLSVISLITFPIVIRQIQNTKTNISDATLKVIYDSAKLYVKDDSNTYQLIESDIYCITLQDLVDKLYLKAPIEDVKTGEEIELTRTVKVEVGAYGALSYSLVKPTKCTSNIQSNPVLPGAIWNYSYTGNYQTFTVPQTGTYQIELWGAQGGGIDTYYGGEGAYISGNIELGRNSVLYIYVGGQGTSTKLANTPIQGGYNGGGNGHTEAADGSYATTGGGATDIRYFGNNNQPTSTNLEWNSSLGLNSRIMVAGGGGGSATNNSHSSIGYGGSGGGLDGLDGTCNQGNFNGTGATQISGGYNTRYSDSILKGTFGKGGAAGGYNSGTGGGGYYGGGSGAGWRAGGGGGSSFISGHNGCDAIAETSTENNIVHTGQSIHYSGLSFTDTIMIDGAGCRWTTEKTSNCTGQPQPNGSTATGHSGDGYARITYVN